MPAAECIATVNQVIGTGGGVTYGSRGRPPAVFLSDVGTRRYLCGRDLALLFAAATSRTSVITR